MKVKMICHLMPWEIDYALVNFLKLKKSSEYLSEDVEIIFDCVLNLSGAVIDWDKSKIDKSYFMDKFNTLKKLVDCFSINRYEVIDTDNLYGHLDLQRESITDDVDGYIYICPDFNFDETTLSYMCNAAKHINDKYYILTPEIYKGWDSSWDIISSEKYKHISHKDCGKECAFRIEYDNLHNEVYLDKINEIKFAGWFDFFSKDFINEFAVFPDSWSGYGPWDLYSLILSYTFNKLNLNEKIHQYVIRGKIIYAIESELYPNGLSGYYRNLIQKKNIKQRESIEGQINSLVYERLSYYSSGNL